MYQKDGNSHLFISQNLIIHCFEVKNATYATTKVNTGWFKKIRPPSDFSYGTTWPARALWAHGLK